MKGQVSWNKLGDEETVNVWNDEREKNNRDSRGEEDAPCSMMKKRNLGMDDGKL